MRMWDNWVGRYIQRSNHWRAFWGYLILAVFGVLAFLARWVVYNLLFGPFPLTPAELAAVESASTQTRYFVDFEPDWYTRTSFQVVDQKSNKPLQDYFLVLVNGRYFVVQVLTGHEGGSFTGFIEEPDSQAREVMDGMEQRVPSLRGQYLPFMVRDTRDRYFTPWAVLIGLSLILAWALWLLGFAWSRMLDPSRHPFARALQRYGEPHEVAAQIDRALVDAPHYTIGPVEFLGPFALCHTLSSGFQVFRVDDLVWVYKSVARINFGSSYGARLHCRDGTIIYVPGDEQTIDDLLTKLVHLAPGVVGGYSPELEDWWEKDRDSFIAEVPRRKEPPA
jgi:hypothetical protein